MARSTVPAGSRRGASSPTPVDATGTPMSVESFRALPEARGYSLLDGLCCREPSPRLSHQEVATAILAALRRHARAARDGHALPPVDVWLDDRNVVVPDAGYVLAERLQFLDESGLHGVAPDLCVEVLSPSTRARDRVAKAALYAKYGCREYWLVEVDGMSIDVMRPGAGGGMRPAGTYHPGEAIDCGAVPGLRFDVGEAFEA